MDTIQVNREQLLEVLKENREQHKKDFEQAHKEWAKQAAKALEKAAKKAKDKGEINVNPLAELPKPQSYLKSYDDAIRRVEFDVRPEIHLEDREFSAWIQDDWNWRGAFVANTSSYLAA